MLVKQFRPPINSYSIEFPAGLIDKGESAKEAGLRELKEETGTVCYTFKMSEYLIRFTGYIGKYISESPPISVECGMTNQLDIIINVEIDMDAKENLEPETELEEQEYIEVFFVQKKNLLKELISKIQLS